MPNEETKRRLGRPAVGHGHVREAVGTFRQEKRLEAAVSALASAGWDRADMSLLAAQSLVSPHLDAVQPAGESAREASDDADLPRGPVVSDPDFRQGRTLAGGMAGVVAAFGAAGAVVVTGGTALAAVVGAAIAGGGAAAAAHAAGRWLTARRDDFLQEQVDRGGILLWVALRKPGQAEMAMEILRQHGAENVHVHALPVAEERAPPLDD